MPKIIAIVEDEPALRENYSAALRTQGYQTHLFAARKEALEAFRKRLPDLILLDIGLSGDAEGGFEVCREVRALSATVPIIFLSARDSDLDIISGLRLGADDYLTKDISLPHLTARISALFRRLEALRTPSVQENCGSTATNLARMRLTCDVIVASSTTICASRINCSRFFTCPGCNANACTIQNSVKVRSTARPRQRTA